MVRVGARIQNSEFRRNGNYRGGSRKDCQLLAVSYQQLVMNNGTLVKKQ
ncbi:hypothetical protein [Okeania sp. SIO2C2]|nr:hypothetical protein [Okeania sp. SIO2C2]